MAIKHGDPALLRKSLEVLAGSRAANLREEATLSLIQQGRLPEVYFTLLKKIQSAEAKGILSPSTTDETQMSHWRAQLASIQDQTGIRLAFFSKDAEKNSHQKTLRDIQQSLGTEDVLLSFRWVDQPSTHRTFGLRSAMRSICMRCPAGKVSRKRQPPFNRRFEEGPVQRPPVKHLAACCFNHWALTFGASDTGWSYPTAYCSIASPGRRFRNWERIL